MNAMNDDLDLFDCIAALRAVMQIVDRTPMMPWELIPDGTNNDALIRARVLLRKHHAQ